MAKLRAVMVVAACLTHGCMSQKATPRPRVTLFDGAADARPARLADSSVLLFDPTPKATDPASFVRAEWPSTARMAVADEDVQWRTTTRNQQDGRGEHYSSRSTDEFLHRHV